MNEFIPEIDKQFKAALNDFSENPPVNVWDAIAKKITQNNATNDQDLLLKTKAENPCNNVCEEIDL